MTGDEYMAVLLERQAEYELEHPPTRPWLRPLLEWFVRPGDEQLVDLSAERGTRPDRAPAKPRTYRSAESLKAERDQLVTQAQQLSDSAALPERAAAHGVALGAHRTARVQIAADRKLRRYVELSKRIDTLNWRIARAEAREARS